MGSGIVPLDSLPEPPPSTPLCVVVPTLNEAAHLGSTLAAAFAQGVPHRLMVVDGGSGDGTADLARDHGVPVLNGVRGRARQMNRGARALSGNRDSSGRDDAILFLHADTRLPEGGLSAVTAALRDPAVVGGRFRVRFDRSHPALRLMAWMSRWPQARFAFGDQAFFVRRSVFEKLGGFETIPLFEDVRFFRRLASHGRVVVLPMSVTTSARRFDDDGVIRSFMRNTGLMAAHDLGISPVRLSCWYAATTRG